MAALYAQGLPWDEAHRKVRTYASRMSSVHHLLQARARPSLAGGQTSYVPDLELNVHWCSE